MLLSGITLAPLAGAIAILLIPRRHLNAIRVTAALSTGVSLLLSLYLLVSYDQVRGGLQFAEFRPWLPSLGATYLLAADGMSIAMILLTALVIFAGVFASWRNDERPKEFFFLLLTLVTGVFGVFASFDLLLFFVFYELAVIPMYLLIAVWGSTRKEYSASKLTLYLLAGSAFLMVGLLSLYFDSGLYTFNLAALQGLNFPAPVQARLFPLLFFGFAFLVPMWPFHTWSPDGHVAAPTAVSMLHAGVLMKLGAYGVIRVAVNLFPQAAQTWMPVVAGLATVNVLYGALVAMAQKDLKYVIGYSSVSHMGYVLLGIASFSALGLSGAVLQMFSHGIMTGLFFALIGLVYGRAHTRIIGELGGLVHQMPIVAAGFFIAALTSLGLPGLSSFVAELMVFFGTFKAFRFLAVLAILAIVVTAAYILRTAQKVFFGPAQERFAHLEDAHTVDFVPLVLLITVLIGVGVFPSVLVNLINTSVVPLVGKIGGLF